MLLAPIDRYILITNTSNHALVVIGDNAARQ